MRIQVIGSGVVGLTAADAFARRGCDVTVISASRGIDASCCSWWAGGMLAPGCEQESAEPLIGELGRESQDYWRGLDSKPQENGTLVLAHPRDLPDLRRFAKLAPGGEPIDGGRIRGLEPDLSDRFARGLFFTGEGHLDPRQALQALERRLRDADVTFETARRVDTAAGESHMEADWRIDARGMAARDTLTDLRGVRGEMLILRTNDIRLSRPVRLLHPRHPIYIVPRANGHFMVGATSVEREDRGPITGRAAMELLSAAFTLHPAFAEAEITETGADLRPAFPDNLPRIRRRGRTLYLNGMYRHGFLAAPAVARRAADFVLDEQVPTELMDENHDQWRAA